MKDYIVTVYFRKPKQSEVPGSDDVRYHEFRVDATDEDDAMILGMQAAERKWPDATIIAERTNVDEIPA